MTRVQECPGSQSRPALKAESPGGEGGEDENESEDEKECEVEAAAAGEVAVESVVAGKLRGHVSEKSAKQEAEQG